MGSPEESGELSFPYGQGEGQCLRNLPESAQNAAAQRTRQAAAKGLWDYECNCGRWNGDMYLVGRAGGGAGIFCGAGYRVWRFLPDRFSYPVGCLLVCGLGIDPSSDSLH